MSYDRESVMRLAEASVAKVEGREALTDLEGLAILEAMGLEVPFFRLVKGAASAREAAREAMARDSATAPRKLVVKVASPEILHKTEVGGVAIIDGNLVPDLPAAVEAAVADMERRFADKRVEGYTINEFVAYEPRIGHEMIVGCRFAPDFGPIVSFGPGGIFAERLAGAFKPGSANVFFSPVNADRALIEESLRGNEICVLASAGLRNTKPAIAFEKIVDVVEAFVRAAPLLAAAGIPEFEVNPFVIAPARGAAGRPDAAGQGARLLALDVLGKVAPISAFGAQLGVDEAGKVVNFEQARRPVKKLERLLVPESAAVIGVSEKGMNNGRIILNNLIHDGFDRKRLYVVKAGTAEIDGCVCVPDVASLPEKVDLFVLVIPAAQAAITIAQLAELDKANSIIVIPGGLEEKGGTEAIVARMREALAASRSKSGGGPLINGGNCLGIRSVPGRYNTLFIPEYKLPMPKGSVAPLAVVSQSGAFAIARVSKHPDINPKYLVTCGNQMDVTVGDWLEHLASDRELEIFAVYIEGFKPLDGEKLLRAVRSIVASGRTVIFYRAGRTAAGAAASASHTASIAGDWPVTRALLEGAGATVATTLDAFDDALTTFTLLRGKKRPAAKAKGSKPPSPRLGAVSNAGFECVAIADNLGSMELATFSPSTAPELERVFAQAKIGEIVDVHNPVDLTPMAGDAAYEETFRAVLADAKVDCGIVGIVPLTAMMNTLAAGPASQGEDVKRDDSIAFRYGKLMKEGDKPWVAVVDSGSLYDPLARELEARGVPTFRTADRALAMLDLWMSSRS
ncbi:MAG TPA: acetate--CoA ligase family protein [Rectinemataceae bacterium]|nr:acetate--CoA ligase family protein [Rectinemataceae bacterium]